MEFPRRRRREVRIDLSGLIDAVFLLLIFFAVSTTFLDTSGLKLELPESETATGRDMDSLQVWVGADGRIRFQGEEVSLPDLEERLKRSLAAGREDRNVILQADRNTPLETVVKVMDRARRAGAEGITIASRPR